MSESSSTLVEAQVRLQKIAMAGVLAVALLLALLALFVPRHQTVGSNGTMPDLDLATLSDTSGPLCIDHVSIPGGAGFVETELGTELQDNVKLELTAIGPRGKKLGSTRSTPVTDGKRLRMKLPTDRREGLTLCYSLLTPGTSVAFQGENNGAIAPLQNPKIGKTQIAGDISLIFISTEKHTAASQVSTVFERASLFRPGWVGAWTFWLIFACSLALIGVGFWLALRITRLTGRPGKKLIAAIAAVAFCNALLWAVLTPAFNVPDELAHFTYVETLAGGEMPDRELAPGDPGNSYKPSTVLASKYTAEGIVQRPLGKPPWSKQAEATFLAEYQQLYDGPDEPYGLTPAKAYTPGYYAPAVVFYKAGGFGNVFDRLLMVRIWSALLLALTIVFVVLFVAELLPRFGWAGGLAGLVVAFTPMVLHMGGGATNDALMLPACAATMWLGARVLMRGPSFWGVFAAAAAFALAMLAKSTAAGLALPLAFVFLVASWRSQRRLAALGTCVSGSLIPAALLAAGLALYGGSATTGVTDPTITEPLYAATPLNFAYYVWQWYLPSIGGMPEFFHGTPPAFRLFFGGFLGEFNSLDTRFPDWVYDFFLAATAVLLVLASRALWVRRTRLRAAWPIVVYPLLALVGMLAVIHGVGFLLFASDGQSFAQGRYLFPALAVFGLFIAAAALGAGKRFGPAVGGASVMALAALNIAGMAYSLARFYA